MFGQLKVLTAIDYFSEKKLWGNGYIAFEPHPRYFYGDKPFFYNNKVIYNIPRYVNDGSSGRIMNVIKNTLENDGKLTLALNSILNFTEI